MTTSRQTNIRNLRELMYKIEKENQHLKEIGDWAYENGLIRDGYYALRNEVESLEQQERLDVAAEREKKEADRKKKAKPNLPW